MSGLWRGISLIEKGSGENKRQSAVGRRQTGIRGLLGVICDWMCAVEIFLVMELFEILRQLHAW